MVATPLYYTTGLPAEGVARSPKTAKPVLSSLESVDFFSTNYSTSNTYVPPQTGVALATTGTAATVREDLHAILLRPVFILRHSITRFKVSVSVRNISLLQRPILRSLFLLNIRHRLLRPRMILIRQHRIHQGSLCRLSSLNRLITRSILNRRDFQRLTKLRPRRHIMVIRHIRINRVLTRRLHRNRLNIRDTRALRGIIIQGSATIRLQHHVIKVRRHNLLRNSQVLTSRVNSTIRGVHTLHGLISHVSQARRSVTRVMRAPPLIRRLGSIRSRLQFSSLQGLSKLRIFRHHNRQEIRANRQHEIRLTTTRRHSKILQVRTNRVLRLNLTHSSTFTRIRRALTHALLNLHSQLKRANSLHVSVLLNSNQRTILISQLMRALSLTQGSHSLTRSLILRKTNMKLLLMTLARILTSIRGNRIILNFRPKGQSLNLSRILRLLLSIQDSITNVSLRQISLHLVRRRFLNRRHFRHLIRQVTIKNMPLHTTLHHRLTHIVHRLKVRGQKEARSNSRLIRRRLLFLNRNPHDRRNRDHHRCAFFRRYIVLCHLCFRGFSPPHSPQHNYATPPHNYK